MSNTVIDKLTKEQEEQIPVYLDRYLKVGMSTEPCDRVKAEAALKASYKYMKLPEPEIVWADSPMQGAVLAAQFAKGSLDVTKAEISDQAGKASYGSFEAYWVAFYAFIAEQLPVKKDELIDIVKEIVQNCGVYWTFKDLIVVTEKPIEIHMVNQKLHNEDGLAVKYKDGHGVFMIDGKRCRSLLENKINATLGDHASE